MEKLFGMTSKKIGLEIFSVSMALCASLMSCASSKSAGKSSSDTVAVDGVEITNSYNNTEALLKKLPVIFTLPLSFIGVALIYLLMRQKISLMAIFGILMLVGIIVNNGIVLVDYANQLRRGGMGLEDACLESARSRLRPIIMSTLTTIISLIPMAFWPSEGAEMIQPINITVLGGLGFGTLMTLFIMPAIYYIFNAKNEKKRIESLSK